MAQIQKLVLRLDATVYDQLKLVAKTLQIPMNKLAQRAIADDLKRKSADLAKELSPRLEKLRRYAESTTGLNDALQTFVDGEAQYAKDDPAEGRHVSRAARAVVASFCLETARNRINTGFRGRPWRGILSQAYAGSMEKSKSRGAGTMAS